MIVSEDLLEHALTGAEVDGDALAASLPDAEARLTGAERLFAAGHQDAAAALAAAAGPAAQALFAAAIARQQRDEATLAAALETAHVALRQPGGRDVALEALLRIERGLVAFEAGEQEVARDHFDWAEQRAKAVGPTSALYGRAVLAKGSFHEAIGEPLMALHVYSEISRHSDHPPEVLGLTRLRAGAILAGLDRQQGALRAFWIAREALASAGEELAALEATLAWCDLGLRCLDPKAASFKAQLAATSVQDDLDRAHTAAVAPSDVERLLDDADGWLDLLAPMDPRRMMVELQIGEMRAALSEDGAAPAGDSAAT